MGSSTVVFYDGHSSCDVDPSAVVFCEVSICCKEPSLLGEVSCTYLRI